MSEHKFWGDNIFFQKMEDKDGIRRTINRVTGWMTPIPEVGDELRCPMQSGKTGRFKITKVDECGDPPDMFFATVEAIGYLK